MRWRAARGSTLSSVFVAALLLATIGPMLRPSSAAAGPAGGAGLGGDVAPPGAMLTAVSVLRRLKERMQGAGEGAEAESSEGEAEAPPMTLSVVDQVLDLVRCSDQDFQPATAPSGATERIDECERPEGDSEATMHADTNNFLAGILSSSISWYADPERVPTPLRMQVLERVSAGDETREDAVTQDEQDEQDLSRACDSELSLVCEREHSRRNSNGFSLDANGLSLVCESEHSQEQADVNERDSAVARDVAGVGVSRAEVSFMSSAVSSPTPPSPPSPSPPPPPPLPPVPSVGPEQVLEYWFEGDWQTNFQKKWFTRAVRGAEWRLNASRVQKQNALCAEGWSSARKRS
jgi:hypothetical protein